MRKEKPGSRARAGEYVKRRVKSKPKKVARARGRQPISEVPSARPGTFLKAFRNGWACELPWIKKNWPNTDRPVTSTLFELCKADLQSVLESSNDMVSFTQNSELIQKNIERIRKVLSYIRPVTAAAPADDVLDFYAVQGIAASSMNRILQKKRPGAPPRRHADALAVLDLERAHPDWELVTITNAVCMCGNNTHGRDCRDRVDKLRKNAKADLSSVLPK